MIRMSSREITQCGHVLAGSSHHERAHVDLPEAGSPRRIMSFAIAKLLSLCCGARQVPAMA